MLRYVYIIFLIFSLICSTSFAAEDDGVVQMLLDSWWILLFIPLTLILKKFFRKLDTND